MHSLFSWLVLWYSFALAASAVRPEPDDSLLEQYGAVCLAAKQSSELGGLLKQLESRQQSCNAADREPLRIAIDFTRTWQRQLDAYNAGKFGESLDVMRELFARHDWVGWVPRSAVEEVWLKRLEPVWFTYTVNHVSDVQPLIDGLTWLQGQGDDKENVQKIRDALNTLAELQKILNNEYADKNDWAEHYCQPRQDEFTGVVDLKLLILPRLLPAYLQLDDRYKPDADRDDITAPSYLLEVQRQAEQQNDLPTVWRALTYRRALEFGNREGEERRVLNEVRPPQMPGNYRPPEMRFDWVMPGLFAPPASMGDRPIWWEQAVAGLNLCLYASRLETKGQTEDAAWCYRYALYFTLPQTAADHAAARLRHIRENFPEDYANSRAPRNPARFLIPPIYLGINSQTDWGMGGASNGMDAGKLWTRY